MKVYTIAVRGIPAPKGSKDFFNGVPVESSKKVKPWMNAIIAEVTRVGWGALRLDVPLMFAATYYFKRPKSHYRTGRFSDELKTDAPVVVSKYPDLDKINRSTYDALTQSGMIRDDSLIVQSSEMKLWGEGDGAFISVAPFILDLQPALDFAVGVHDVDLPGGSPILVPGSPQ